ncbi:unnamed protein product [Mycena citricolor]|uniref:BAG domain-containing protein n=1 Tax=Mycena citricolor TaxID=2018698 RepID=A0AAD2H9Q7_9AGAR|nr:unnamed protein product [Mycena citricolor]
MFYYPRQQGGYGGYGAYDPYAVARQRELQRQQLLAQERERQRLAHIQRQRQYEALERERLSHQYSPYGPSTDQYDPDYEENEDEDDSEVYQYLTPRQRAMMQAKRRQLVMEDQRRAQVQAQRQADAQRQRAASQSPQRPTVPEDASIPIPSDAAPMTSPETTPSPPPHLSPTASTSSSKTTFSAEQREEAASTIQRAFRVYRALRTISDFEMRFEAIRREFCPPTTLEYIVDGQVVSVPVPQVLSAIRSDAVPSDDVEQEAARTPKLAYTAPSRPIHGHLDALSKLLIALDGVESFGDKHVRERRKSVVGRVEQEARAVEIWVRDVWASQLQSDVTQEEDEVRDMVVDPAHSAEDQEDEDDDAEFVTPPGTPATEPLPLVGDDDFVMI